MAKPLRKTPTLKGKNADEFLKKMIATSKRKSLNKNEKMFLGLIK